VSFIGAVRKSELVRPLLNEDHSQNLLTMSVLAFWQARPLGRALKQRPEIFSRLIERRHAYLGVLLPGRAGLNPGSEG